MPMQEDSPGTADKHDTQTHQEQGVPPRDSKTPAQGDGHGYLETGEHPGQEKGKLAEVDGKGKHSGKGHHPPGAPVESPDGQEETRQQTRQHEPPNHDGPADGQRSACRREAAMAMPNVAGTISASRGATVVTNTGSPRRSGEVTSRRRLSRSTVTMPDGRTLQVNPGGRRAA